MDVCLVKCKCFDFLTETKAPWVYRAMWKLVEAVISTKTAARVVFLGNDKKLWREEISKVLQLDQFPKRYGGDGNDDQKVIIS
jgi:hypothetical protein